MPASVSDERKPCEKSITCAMRSQSGWIIAMLRNSCFRLSGRFDRPA